MSLKTIAERRRISVRFRDEAAIAPTIDISDSESTGRKPLSGRTPTPAASKFADGYFQSQNEGDLDEIISHQIKPEEELLSPRSQTFIPADKQNIRLSHRASARGATRERACNSGHDNYSFQEFDPSEFTPRNATHFTNTSDFASHDFTQPVSYPERAYESPNHHTHEAMARAQAEAIRKLEQKPLENFRCNQGSEESLAAIRDDSRRESDVTLVGRPDSQNGKVHPTSGNNLGSLELAGIYGSDPRHRTITPVKPSLRRGNTEEVVEKEPVRNATNIVESHLKRRSGQIINHSEHRIDLNINPSSNEDVEAPEPPKYPKAGVLSHLLELYGNNSSNAISRCGSENSATTFAGESVATSRQASNDSRVFQRKRSSSSKAGNNGEINSSKDILDDGKQNSKKTTLRKRSSSGRSSHRREKSQCSDGFDSDNTSVKSLYSGITFKSVVGAMQDKIHGRKAKDKRRRASITMHVADILKRQNFILKLAKALMATGAPSHRLESQLSATAKVLEIDAQFIHLPSVVIAAFGDYDTRTSEIHFVKAIGGIALGKLHRVHEVYKAVVHDEAGVAEGSAALHKISNEPPLYADWQRMIIAAFCCGIISMLGFAGSFADAWVSAIFGSFLAFMQLRATGNQMYSNIFEISIATLVSFVSRGLSTTDYFCYESLSSAGVVLILPGYTILCGSLELASKNLVAGSVRMVYSVIYSLFLGFGISIGSDFYYLLDPHARIASEMRKEASRYTLSGSFTGLNGTLPVIMGDFTFADSQRGTAMSNHLASGDIICYRDPSWQWWRQSLSPWWSFLLVPAFSFFLSLWNLQPIRSRQMPVMVIIACVGWVCNHFANLFIFNRSDVVSFLGAFIIGIMGNMYSRIFKGTAFTSMTTGVLFLVPSGIAAAGGLAMTYHAGSGDSYSNGLVIGFRMVQVAIGITVGLFFSSFVVYSFGRGKSSAAFTF
ncbi:hypothetical protein BY996DRAFT_4591786 [Phakopsora pachyrhizi]|uniref:Threonine/serine exporter-like N-terminal domain-containing protein n=1 Tax=Phakopsora pachyrhizi TaxID=170000 RepID=A0AAV0B8C1_PHAPC|nr:hypothetical protein BY996DRAFT_4598190 [Phakopsora pachyrhizi]KAI8448131.1 hypothetical protein BY996DRAFT_4591786 [Phakopsora pachyrhizi]CAH7682335.1 hypothetical protein PPACK8108_LOCUS15195 [Phakopsora pachyrhizi]CAH7683164.1 hypothetical protein PPACK8108_LOCUS16528 [Phakopsora pachyrhizi]